MSNNYTLTHLHSSYSILDSCTDFREYIDWAVEHSMKSIVFTEHGNVLGQIEKKQYCDKKGIKYIHGTELYITSLLHHKRYKITENKDKSFNIDETSQKIRDNYHVILIAKNHDGRKELNRLISTANDEEHFYFKPRITVEEFLNTSDNIISTSACLAGIISGYPKTISNFNIEIKSLENENEQRTQVIQMLYDELNGESTIRKKKRKDDKIQADINLEQAYIDTNNLNIECIKADINDMKFKFHNVLKKFTYLEVQPHVNSDDQRELNREVLRYSTLENIPIICGTDTHSSDTYHAECRALLMEAKKIDFLEEDTFDLTLKTYDEVYNMFKQQDVLTDEQIEEALENTNKLADMCEDFELDKSFKYPVFDTPENDKKEFIQRCWDGLDEKIACGAIPSTQRDIYANRIKEELAAFEKTNMIGFMLSMSEFIGECRRENIPFGPNRGSSGGSLCAYLTDITDCDPIIYKLDFSRFCNEDRVSLGDIDVDLRAEDRPKVLQRIVDRFGREHVARVLAVVTNDKLGAIDDIGRAFAFKWIKEHGKSTKELKIKKREIQKSSMTKVEKKQQIETINDEIKSINEYNEKLNNPYSLKHVAEMKKLIKEDENKFKEKYEEIYKYIDGFTCAKLSLSKHAAGYCVSNINLFEEYGIMYNDGDVVSQLQMEEMHDVNLVKYDLLVLKSISVLQKICDYVGIQYPRMYQVDWNDMNVWDDLADNCLAIPQFEGAQAGNMVATMHPTNVEELAIINAALRPAGASYRDNLMKRIQHHSPNPEVDDFLKETYGVMCFQENIMQFLVRFCGMTGAQSDSMRRLISSKDHTKINAAIPEIVDGYCANRDLPRKESEKEAQEYIQVIKDAGSYAFNKSHALGYSMLGYIFGYMRYHHPLEFICAFLNYAANEEDIQNGTKLATIKGIEIEEPKFRFGQADYSFDTNKHVIYKGMGSIKYLNNKVATQLYSLRNKTYKNFFYVLDDIRFTSINSRQLEILIKLDFFREFGNTKLILNYVNMWNKFKTSGGNYIQSLKKDFTTSSVLKNIVEHHATETNTRYQITDMFGIFDDISDVLQSLNIKDFSIKEKIATQKEYLGYISLKTDKKEDIHKLYIVDMIPLKVKKGNRAGQIWARILKTHSIGRGKNGEMMILENDYQRQYQFQKEDVIEFDVSGFKKDSYNGTEQYWISKYNIVLD